MFNLVYKSVVVECSTGVEDLAKAIEKKSEEMLNNPSCLIFGYNVNGRILHIVAGCDNINIYIITAYYPDTKKFENDLKTRRKR